VFNIQVAEALPNVVCPVCDVHGGIEGQGEEMKVRWNRFLHQSRRDLAAGPSGILFLSGVHHCSRESYRKDMI
jgi:hypothetical protein